MAVRFSKGRTVTTITTSRAERLSYSPKKKPHRSGGAFVFGKPNSFGLFGFALFGGLRPGAFFEQGFGGNCGFFGLGRFDEHVFAARLPFGLVLGARHIDGDVYTDFRMQHDADLMQADALDRLIERHLGAVDAEATGAGETAITIAGSAIGNAIFDATGARIRQIPYTPERVKAALAARG